MGVSYNY
ncbi:hypothetical protein CGLO_18450 [Colletotrichum gloeosporioides Cg-14]|nr:hypothetical protein CGLO_18450 [Colletotrichum gloeosporioides Cg-14]